MLIEKANKIIAETLGTTVNEVNPDQHLCYDLLADSLALTDLFINLESTFSIKIQERDIEKINYVKDIHQIICQRSRSPDSCCKEE